jgi:hypothetical protein
VLTLSLDLEPWLDGERVDSLRAQAISEWARRSSSMQNQTKRWSSEHVQVRLERYIEKRIQNPPRRITTDGVLRDLIPDLEEEFGSKAQAIDAWKEIYKKWVEDRASAPIWNSNNHYQNAQWLVFQWLRKLPSPGRVYRFWREAIEFFEDLLREFRQIASRSDNPWRVRRLLLIPDASTAHGWKSGMLYDGRWRGVQISLVYVGNLKGFVTASNLARLLKPEEHKEALQNQTITVEEEDTFGQSVSLTVRSVKELSGSYAHLGVYHPVIPLEVSPLRFRVVLPLEAASECVDLAIARWRERFARVWDRLPLRVGVVGFPRALSFQAVVEAVRNVEEALVREAEIWQVEKRWIQAGIVTLRLRREDGQSVPRSIPLLLSDGREDVFYPYAQVEDPTLRYPRDFRHPGSGRVFRHVADLRLGDGIRVAPATVTAIWMESAAVRFEPLKSRYLEDWTRMREVWRLVERVAPSATALQRLWSAVNELRARWRAPDGSWAAPEDLRRDTLRALLAEHLELQGADLETLVEAAMEDLLPWALDWHLTALQERP